MSIESTHSRSWVSDRASFGCRLGMTYPHQDGCVGVAGGTNPAPCPTPVAPFARVCTSSRTSQGCYNPVKTATSPISSSGISISWRSLGTSTSSVLRHLCVAFGVSSGRRFMHCAVVSRMSHWGSDKVVRCVLHAQPWLESGGSLALPAYYAGAITMQGGGVGVTCKSIHKVTSVVNRHENQKAKHAANAFMAKSASVT